MIRTACLSLAAFVLIALPSTASAHWPYYGDGGWGGGPWSHFNYNYGVGYVPPPPYYAIFPPVYYGPHITARHYGASPYAWPAGFAPTSYAVRGYAAAPAKPEWINNPYVMVEGAPA